MEMMPECEFNRHRPPPCSLPRCRPQKKSSEEDLGMKSFLGESFQNRSQAQMSQVAPVLVTLVPSVKTAF